ncbi:IS3 family transposase, partial [Streptomyces atratus]
MPSTEPVGSDPAPRPKRRTFTSEYIVAEHDAAPVNEKGAVLRRERLYHSHVKEWRAARDAGALENLVDRRTSPARAKKSAAEV